MFDSYFCGSGNVGLPFFLIAFVFLTTFTILPDYETFCLDFIAFFCDEVAACFWRGEGFCGLLPPMLRSNDCTCIIYCWNESLLVLGCSGCRTGLVLFFA